MVQVDDLCELFCLLSESQVAEHGGLELVLERRDLIVGELEFDLHLLRVSDAFHGQILGICW